ncbi:MAG: aminodeoxychorismate lyase [Proteobacteria bacterium]|nr:MAG: aminodeoxychorismate lyase [Pseudomonadota bacterium]
MIIAASFDLHDETMWENRALMYGDGVFETIRLVHNRMPLWAWHQQRLQQSCAYLQIKTPDLKAMAGLIQDQATESNAVIRLTVFRQQATRGYQPHSHACEWLMSQHPYQPQSHRQTLALADQRLTPQPILRAMKHLNRLPQILIANELCDKKVDDLVVLNQQDDVIETTCQNLLVIKNNQIYTPDMQYCGVEGVALSWLKRQLALNTVKLKLQDIKDSDAVMTANAIHGFRVVKSIKSLGSFQINHPICDRIHSLWQHLID